MVRPTRLTSRQRIMEPMHTVVTGGAGFIGQAVVRRLRARGDAVTALVRDAGRAEALRELGCMVVEIDLATATLADLADVLRGADAVFHLAGSYRVGIPESEHAPMFAANVVATRTILDAAVAAGVPRTVHVSSVNVFGDTRGAVVDEAYRRPQPPSFVSYYDETKYLAHLAAEERIAAGAPILIAMPGMVYGPGDHSQVGGVIRQAMAGTLAAVNAADLGGSLVHVDDVAAGILLVHDTGRNGEAYVLGGEVATLGEVVRRAAAVAGRDPPRITTPSWLLRAAIPFSPILGPALGGEPNLAEIIRSSAGVTFWASSEKAKRELGYAPRDLDAGLRTLLDPADARLVTGD
jgi:nucleoside-diphosphate-sugar epimerase